jgi:hypothetical protein
MIQKFNQLTNVMFLLFYMDDRDPVDLSGVVRISILFFIFIIILELVFLNVATWTAYVHAVYNPLSESHVVQDI